MSWPDASTADDAARMLARAAHKIDAWCEREHLAAGVRAQLASVYAPLAAYIARARAERPPNTLVVGLAGAQGTGKSTLAALLACLLDAGYGLRAARLSLDDFYLTRAEREALARDVHPLLRTRGVPGTHDVALAMRTIAALCAARDADAVACPRFDKARDDRVPDAAWPIWRGASDVLLLEGWCVGAEPEAEASLVAPLNALERDEDRDARFRRHVNAQLGGAYRTLFARLDLRVFLAAPDMLGVLAWRTQQEHELAARSGGASAVMSDAQLARFVQHYERISRHMLADAPARSDVVLRLTRDHSVGRVELRPQSFAHTASS